MKRRALVVSLAALLTAAAAPAVRAQDAAAGPRIVWHFGAVGGLAVPMSDLKNAFKTGWQAQPFVAATRGNWGLALIGSYNEMKEDTVGTPAVEEKFKAIGGILNLVYLFPTPGSVKPYVFAGPAVFNLKVETEGADYEIVDETKVGVSGGLGLMYFLKSGLGIGVEGAVNYVSFTPEGLTESTKYVWTPISVGFMYTP